MISSFSRSDLQLWPDGIGNDAVTCQSGQFATPMTSFRPLHQPVKDICVQWDFSLGLVHVPCQILRAPWLTFLFLSAPVASLSDFWLPGSSCGCFFSPQWTLPACDPSQNSRYPCQIPVCTGIWLSSWKNLSAFNNKDYNYIYAGVCCFWA